VEEVKNFHQLKDETFNLQVTGDHIFLALVCQEAGQIALDRLSDVDDHLLIFQRGLNQIEKVRMSKLGQTVGIFFQNIEYFILGALRCFLVKLFFVKSENRDLLHGFVLLSGFVDRPEVMETTLEVGVFGHVVVLG
jgi:hypothetical protein